MGCKFIAVWIKLALADYTYSKCQRLIIQVTCRPLQISVMYGRDLFGNISFGCIIWWPGNST